jgi:hypothetical protein
VYVRDTAKRNREGIEKILQAAEILPNRCYVIHNALKTLEASIAR